MKRNINVGYRGMERKEGLEFHGAPSPKGGRHPEDTMGCPGCGRELEPHEESVGMCKDCAGKERATQSKLDARMGKGIRDYIDLVKGCGVLPDGSGFFTATVGKKKKKKKMKKAGMGMPTMPSVTSPSPLAAKKPRKPKTVQTITTRISQGVGMARGIREFADLAKAGMGMPTMPSMAVASAKKPKKPKVTSMDGKHPWTGKPQESPLIPWGGITKSIKRTPVDSSNLKDVGYDPASKKLHVGFHYKGAVYEYDDVSPGEHKALMSAPSIGEHFNKHIRKTKEYRQIKSEAESMGILDYIEKARSKPWRSKKGKAKVERTMHEWGEGRLRSGSKHGRVVTDQKQAIAIALNQARKAGHKKSLGILDYVDIQKGVLGDVVGKIGGALRRTDKAAVQGAHMRRLGMGTCPHCKGSGGQGGSMSAKVPNCTHCGGKGLVMTRSLGDGIIDFIIKAKSMKPGGGGRFAKLKGKLAHRKGVTNPGALAGWIGRKKYGASKMGKFSAKGRKRAKK